MVLKILPYESATSFQTLKSDGAWKAYVVRGDRHFIDLGADTVRGSTGSPIDFTVKFKGPCGENESRFAIICVDYNNYSCRHLIFVRQGESPGRPCRKRQEMARLQHAYRYAGDSKSGG